MTPGGHVPAPVLGLRIVIVANQTRMVETVNAPGPPAWECFVVLGGKAEEEEDVRPGQGRRKGVVCFFLSLVHARSHPGGPLDRINVLMSI